MQIIPIRASRPALAPAPRILPDTTDKTLEERAFARLMASYSLFHTGCPYEIVRRQGDYARRLDALAAQRGQE